MSGTGTGNFAIGLKASQNKLRRGWILRILNYFNHSASREVNDRLIMEGLEQQGHGVSMPTLHADLRFLGEKGFVHIREPERPAGIAMVAWISARGTELHERIIDDPAIEFGS